MNHGSTLPFITLGDLPVSRVNFRRLSFKCAALIIRGYAQGLGSRV